MAIDKKNPFFVDQLLSYSIRICLLPYLLTSIALLSFGTTNTYIVDENSSYFITNETWGKTLNGGDTVFILSSRKKALKFLEISGEKNNPVVIINAGGQVQIDSPTAWGAITFENCKFIKITGNGHSEFKYGFKLAAKTCGLAFSELSSDCEAEFIHIDHEGFFGIFAKKDYGGNPPSPAPVFSNLIIHDCFIQNVTEGMYLGETKSPGMEFRHVKIYNNIVKNTGRESIQIANMVEDVEIHNNTLLNAGMDNELYQNNILQIGDNSVAKVYNNILIGAPSWGIIALGMGNITITNNYLDSSKGIFIDNRIFSNENEPVVISGNYFSNTLGNEIIKNMNEINRIEVINNRWDTDIQFYNNASGDDNNFVLTGNLFQQVEKMHFTNPLESDYSLAAGTPSEYQNMGAPGGPFIVDQQDEDQESFSYQKIELTPDMIIDMVEGGSYHSPIYLVDEQNCSPENNLHPVSVSWKPHWNMDKAPYHVIIDLKKVLPLGQIAFHDMHNVANLEVSWGEPGKWNVLLTEPCNKYKTWKNHTVNIETRYLRLTMNETVYAAVNEIALYTIVPVVVEKSAGRSSDLVVSYNRFKISGTKITIYPNPALQIINIELPTQKINYFNVEIYNLNGNLVYNTSYSNHNSSTITIDLTNLFMEDGVYCLRYSDDKGRTQTTKFTKK